MSRPAVPTVLIAGDGPAAALVALHLARSARATGERLTVAVVGPAARIGGGTAFSTADEDHLLNVPACNMSALPDEPDHFVRWREREVDSARPMDFAPR